MDMKDNDKQRNGSRDPYSHAFDSHHTDVCHDILSNRIRRVLLMDNGHGRIWEEYLQVIRLLEKTNRSHVHNHCTLYDGPDELIEEKNKGSNLSSEKKGNIYEKLSNLNNDRHVNE